MKIIDNRYKIEGKIEDIISHETYLVSDLWGDETKKVMKLYNYEDHKKIIDYFISDFIEISKIKYKNILSNEKFNIIKSIDAKKNNMLLYYTISEYIQGPTLKEVLHKLNFNEKLQIILDILTSIEYLHFRGFTYQMLSPSEIYILDNNTVKLTDLATIIEKRNGSYFDDFSRYFISPEALINRDIHSKNADYYSIGVLIKYLMLEDFLEEDSNNFTYKDESILSKNMKALLDAIILQLTKRDLTSREVNLIDLVDDINSTFNLSYSYDLVQSRNTLFFNNKIVGRENEIQQIMEIDKNLLEGNNSYKGLIINGELGVGKTRLLNEVIHRLKMKGRDVYYLDIKDDKNNDLSDIANILKQSLKDAPTELMEKYRDELSKILPDLRLYSNEDIEANLSISWERFRLYNRVSNYFSELSKENLIYIVLDDIQYASVNLLSMIDYLLNNIRNNNLFFIFSYDKNSDILDSLIRKKINEWRLNNLVFNMDLSKLNLEEIGQVIQNILGISYVPNKLASALFKESQSNPRYIEYFIKHLFAVGELYINSTGKWYLKADSYSDIYFPSNINEVFEKQLKLIKDNFFKIFKIISIFDGVLYKKILLSMLDISGKEIDEQLNKLISLGLIDEKLGDWGYSYNIKSIELKRMIYNEISQEEKIKLHALAANILIDFNKDNMDFIQEELLYHLIKSKQTNKAFELILQKLDLIENIYSAQGKFLLEKAYSIIEEDSSLIKLEILDNLVQVFYVKGESEKGKFYFKEYQKLALMMKNYKHIIKGKMVLLDLYHRRVEIDKALKEIEEIELISKEHNIVDGHIISLISKARINIQLGDLYQAESNLYKAIDLSNNYKIKDYLGTIYNRLGVIKYLNGNMKEAIENYDKSIKYCQETGNMIEATRPINNIGNIYSDHFDNPQKAMEYYEKGQEIAAKYGIQEAEVVFLNNISEIYIDSFQYDIALEYLEKVKNGAIELQDKSLIFLANVNMGNIFLANSQFDKAFDILQELKEIFNTNQITDLDITSQYYDFLGNFFSTFGDFDKGIEFSTLACNICKEFNFKGFLALKSRIVVLEFIKSNYLNKKAIEEIRQSYRNRKVSVHRRKALLNFALISLMSGDIEYTKDLLNEDFELEEIIKVEYLELFRASIVYSIESIEKSFDDLIKLDDKLLEKGLINERLLIVMNLGIKLFNRGQYKESLKYLIEALDMVYKITLKIPCDELKFSFIKSRNIDCIKRRIGIAINKVFNCDIDYTTLDMVYKDNLYSYFDLTDLINVMGSEDFVNITQFDYYGEAVNINSVEELISKFTEDYKYNLNLILKYLSKETFAKKGVILSYDEVNKNFYQITSLNNGEDYFINDSILNLAGSSSKGILINKNNIEGNNYSYLEFLKDDIKGIICVPITIFRGSDKIEIDRRKCNYNEKNIQGYIYLETDNMFNRFDYERLEIVRNLSYLIYINLENNKLRLMATTDKLTNTLTRKYFEIRFNELISSIKSTNESFSLLILDIDKFKLINDTYGHRKGDEILSIIGSTIKSTIRSTDIVGRFGGEEFIIILKNVSEEEAIDVAEKIRANIEKITVKGIDNSITVSIGISLFPSHSIFSDDLIEKADQALYYAKELGRNRIFTWNPEMNNTLNRVDKLAGIITGDLDSDNRNVLAIIDIIELIKDARTFEEKAFIFLGRILETIEGQYGTILVLEDNKVKTQLTRERFSNNWVDTPYLNNKNIIKAIETKKGEFFIDWENLENIDSISGLPDWQSVIILPLVKNNIVGGILYITTSIRKKEFDFNSFNLAKYLSNIFAALL